jgi:nitrogen fixation protein FixH
MNLQTIRTNPWPSAIIGWFLLFGAGLAAWVAVAVRNEPELVRADYYEQEIGYQKQIDRQTRTAAAHAAVSVSYESARQQIALRLPAAHLADKPSGSIHFYRPSNAKLDFELPLAVDAGGTQRVPADKLPGGLWKVRVQWTSGGQEFYHDQSLVLGK